MQTKDHLALGRYLARVFEIEEPVKKIRICNWKYHAGC